MQQMPRGGSKKGEHRGAAKRETKRGGKPGPPKGQTNNPNGRPKGSVNRAIRERLAIIGKEIGVAELNGVMPKEVMLKIMRTFMKMAMDEQAAIEKIVSEPDVDEGQIEALTAAFERHIVLAGDMAYKAASYYHPRLQALMVGGTNSDKSPGDILRAMLDEIDGEARVERAQTKQIEHVPLVKDMN